MTILTIPCFFGLFLLVGCSTTHIVPRDPGSKGFINAKDRLEGNAVAVKRIEGDDIRLDLLSFQGDTLVGYDHDTRAAATVPLSDVDEITASNPMRGAGRGFVQGVAIGGFVGGLCGIQIFNPNHEYSFVAPAVGALLGGLTGAIGGASSLSTEHYLLGEERDERFEKMAHDTLTHQENLGLEGFSPSEVITLKLVPLHDETREAISILWDGKPVWLPKSKIKFERLRGGLINLAVPKNLLESPPEK